MSLEDFEKRKRRQQDYQEGFEAGVNWAIAEAAKACEKRAEGHLPSEGNIERRLEAEDCATVIRDLANRPNGDET